MVRDGAVDARVDVAHPKMALTSRKCNRRESAAQWRARWVTIEGMATQHLLAESDEDFEDFPCDVLAENCPSRAALEHIAGRWGSLVLVALRKGPTRFNELRRRVSGVSEKMLAQSLHALERDGIVVREVHSTIPPRVEYSLTPLGEQTADKLWELVAFLQDSMPQILTARQAYDESAAEG